MKKFDIVLMNPPYNSPRGNTRSTKIKQIYPDFVDLAIFLSDNVWSVLPSRWLTLPMSKKIRIKFLKNKLKYLKIIDSKQRYFNNAVIEGGVCYVNFDKKYNGIPIYELEDNTIIQKEFEDQIFLNNNLNLFDGIKLKIKNNNKHNKYMKDIWFQNQEIKSNDKRINETNGYIIRTAKGMKKLDVDRSFEFIEKLNYNKYKTVFSYTTTNYKNGYGRQFIDDKNQFVNMSYAYFPHSSKKEAINCQKYLNTKFVMGLKNITQVNINFTSIVFKYIPIVDFSRSWTDQELYDYFNLTQEEIDYIEANV
jgi:hypothetical protein